MYRRRIIFDLLLDTSSFIYFSLHRIFYAYLSFLDRQYRVRLYLFIYFFILFSSPFFSLNYLFLICVWHLWLILVHPNAIHEHDLKSSLVDFIKQEGWDGVSDFIRKCVVAKNRAPGNQWYCCIVIIFVYTNYISYSIVLYYILYSTLFTSIQIFGKLCFARKWWCLGLAS